MDDLEERRRRMSDRIYAALKPVVDGIDRLPNRKAIITTVITSFICTAMESAEGEIADDAAVDAVIDKFIRGYLGSTLVKEIGDWKKAGYP
jgi:hypothetical protein